MNPFVNILHLNLVKKLSLEELNAFYNNSSYLKESISKIITDVSFNNKSILIKPNWVLHPRNDSDKLCLITNENFILAFVELIIEERPKSIVIGDAPIQGCDFSKLLSSDFLNKIDSLKNKSNVSILIKDFRRTIYNKTKNQLYRDNNPIEDYLIFDTGESSYLEPITTSHSSFRVTDYDPDKLAVTHRRGVHKYCITKELFESDIIITIPKIKTHQKAGITNALKILVGINGDKDFLPHHRAGGTKDGGDCYPGSHPLRKMSEKILDFANKRIGKFEYPYIKLFARALWKLSKPSRQHSFTAAWYGNDTTWRMVLDINTIALYGKADGTLAKTPQRELYTICDGIIGGQGNGPLDPIPLPLGVLCFSNNSALTDAAIAILLNFDVDKIPLVKNALKYFDSKNFLIRMNDVEVASLDDLSAFSIKTLPPPGWIGHIEKES